MISKTTRWLLMCFALITAFSFSVNAQVFLSESFDASTSSPTGWVSNGYSGTSSQSCSGNSFRDNVYSGSTTGSLTSPDISGSNGTDVTISYDYKVVDWSAATVPTTGDWGNIVLEYSTDGGATFTSINTVDPTNHTPSATCATITEVVPGASVPSTIQVRITGNFGTAGDFYIYLDNVTVSQAGGCNPPSALAAAATSPTDIEFSFVDNASAANFNIEYGPAGFTPGTGTATTATASPAAITGLTPATAYDFYVTADCGGSQSTQSGPASASTPPLPPACGGKFYDSGGPSANYSSNELITTTICPDVAGDVVTVTFLSFATESCCDDLTVYDGSDATAPSLGVFAGTAAPGPFTSTDPLGCLTFVFDSDGSVQAAGWDADVTCGPPPSCPAPSSVATANVTDVLADVTFVAPGGQTVFEAAIFASGADPLTATPLFTQTGASSPFSFTGLTPSTSYDAYVRTDCSAASAGMSDWTGPAAFTTADPAPANDECANATSLTVQASGNCAGNEITVNLGAATDSNTGNPTCDGFGVNLDVWYTFTAPATGGIVFNTNNTTVEAAVFDDCAQTTELFCSTGSTDGKTVSGLTPNAVYTLNIWQDDFNAGTDFQLCIEALPACQAPTALSSSNVTTTGADLSFTANDLGAHTIEYGVSPLTAGGGTTVSLAAGVTTTTLTGLTASTTYDFIVTADCGSAVGGPASFTTSDPPPPCGGKFYDSGGPSANYSSNELITTTICPDVAGDVVTVTFLSFETEGCCDDLTVYDGSDATAPSLGVFAGTATPGPFTSTDPLGCLTFVFDSDGSVQAAGWDADITCAPPVLPAVAPASGCMGTLTATVDGSGTPAVVDFIDAAGNIYASIENTQNLGSVDVSLYGGAARQFGADFYLDRNVAIVPTTQPTAPVTVTMYALNSEVTALINASQTSGAPANSVNDMQFVKVAGTASCSPTYPGGATLVSLSATPYLTDWAFSGPVSSFSEFFVLPSAVPLPVELASFNAYATDEGNRVEWTAATEVDFYMYTVERATNPASFISLAEVAPKGTASAEAVYSTDDLNPSPTTYYRLRMEDLDGTVEYSDVVAVRRDDISGGIKMFPNPAKEHVTFEILPGVTDNGTVSVVLTDLNGRSVREWNLAAGQRTSVSLSGIPSGVYMVSSVSAAGTASQRLVID